MTARRPATRVQSRSSSFPVDRPTSDPVPVSKVSAQSHNLVVSTPDRHHIQSPVRDGWPTSRYGGRAQEDETFPERVSTTAPLSVRPPGSPSGLEHVLEAQTGCVEHEPSLSRSYTANVDHDPSAHILRARPAAPAPAPRSSSCAHRSPCWFIRSLNQRMTPTRLMAWPKPGDYNADRLHHGGLVPVLARELTYSLAEHRGKTSIHGDLDGSGAVFEKVLGLGRGRTLARCHGRPAASAVGPSTLTGSPFNGASRSASTAFESARKRLDPIESTANVSLEIWADHRPRQSGAFHGPIATQRLIPGCALCESSPFDPGDILNPYHDQHLRSAADAAADPGLQAFAGRTIEQVRVSPLFMGAAREASILSVFGPTPPARSRNSVSIEASL